MRRACRWLTSSSNGPYRARTASTGSSRGRRSAGVGTSRARPARRRPSPIRWRRRTCASTPRPWAPGHTGRSADAGRRWPGWPARSPPARVAVGPHDPGVGIGGQQGVEVPQVVRGLEHPSLGGLARLQGLQGRAGAGRRRGPCRPARATGRRSGTWAWVSRASVRTSYMKRLTHSWARVAPKGCMTRSGGLSFNSPSSSLAVRAILGSAAASSSVAGGIRWAASHCEQVPVHRGRGPGGC